MSYIRLLALILFSFSVLLKGAALRLARCTPAPCRCWTSPCFPAFDFIPGMAHTLTGFQGSRVELLAACYLRRTRILIAHLSILALLDSSSPIAIHHLFAVNADNARYLRRHV